MAGRGMAPTKGRDQRRRPGATPGYRQLPIEGRLGDPPGWPLSEAGAEENTLWKKLWTLPQATLWEQMRCEDTVALYVRMFVEMTLTDSTSTMVKLGNEVRQLDSKLGLSPRAMLDLRWEIEAAPEERLPSSAAALDQAFVPSTDDDSK